MILLENVYKIYPNSMVGLENASLEINEGEFVFIVGKTGSGKSTLLKLITAELSPTKGCLSVCNIGLNNLDRKHLPYYRRLLGIIDKEVPLLPNKTVYENLEFAMIAAEQTTKKIHESIPLALKLVGMSKKTNEYPENLSEGERIRIIMARAVVNNPKIIIADEPTANLDYDTAWDIICLFNDINKLGITIIIATHAKEFVDIMKKRVVTMRNGKIFGDVEKGKYGWIIW